MTTASVTFDVVPSISGVEAGSVVDAGEVSLFASSAIPNDAMETLFTPLSGSGGSTNVEVFADPDGDIFSSSVISPSSPLAPNEYQAAMTTVDSNSSESDAATMDFFVAPAQPAIGSLTDEENINQSAPNVSVSGVLSGATIALYTVDSQGDPVLLDQTTASTAGTQTFTGLSDLADGNDPLYAVQTMNENGTQISSDGGISVNTPPDPAALIAINVDTATPALSSFDVADGDTTRNSQPYFDVSNGPIDNENNTSGVEFFLTGPNGPVNSGVVETDGGGQTSWQPATALPDGSYAISVRSVDDSGHVGAASRTACRSRSIRPHPRCRPWSPRRTGRRSPAARR